MHMTHGTQMAIVFILINMITTISHNTIGFMIAMSHIVMLVTLIIVNLTNAENHFQEMLMLIHVILTDIYMMIQCLMKNTNIIISINPMMSYTSPFKTILSW